jgi:hypothetical protein
MTGGSTTAGVSIASLVSGPAGTMTITTTGAATHIIMDDTTIHIIAIYPRIKLLTVDNCVVSMGRRGLATFAGPF